MAEIQVQARWILDSGTVPSPANQILIQSGELGADFYLTFGHLNPPVFELAPGEVPTPEMVQGALYPVVPVARVLLSEAKLRELREKIDLILAATKEAAS